MKRILALILLLSFAAQAFSQCIVLAGFYFNQSYIAKKQCENRYRPMLHCNGKCQLAKKLQQQEKNERQNPEIKLTAKSEVISSRSFFNAAIAIFSPTHFQYHFFSDNRIADRAIPFFHPPCN